LQPDLARRYQAARHLQEDLERQLEYRPLKHTREPSWRERVQKQLRRSPWLPVRLAAGAVAGTLLLATWFGWRWYDQQLDEQAEWQKTQLDEKADLQAKQAKQEAVREEHLQQTRALESLSQLRHDFPRIVFPLMMDEDVEHKQRARELCHNTLERYLALDQANWRARPLYSFLAAGEKKRVEKQIGLLLLVYVRALLSTEPAQASPSVLREAVRLTGEAGRCLAAEGEPARWCVLKEAALLDQLGEGQRAQALRDQVAEHAPRERAAACLGLLSAPLGQGPFAAAAGCTSRGGWPKWRTAQELYLAAHELTLHHQYRLAEPLLIRATRLDPQDYWASLLLGHCCDGLNKDEEATQAYSVCIALDPSFYGAYYNRGLAHLRQKSYEKAIEDFDKTIHNGGRLADCYFRRALAWRQGQRDDRALTDLNSALAAGGPPLQILAVRAQVQRSLHDQEGYQRDMAECLKRQPGQELDWLARGMARARTDPRGALADFDEALKINPTSRPALNNKAYVLAEILNKQPEAVVQLNKVIKLFPDYAEAYSARGVSFARLGNREAALNDAAVLARGRKALMHYQVGCIYALTSQRHPDDRQKALFYLRLAVSEGFLAWARNENYGDNLIQTDDDLRALRPLPEFRDLLQAVAVLQRKQ
jgi:tetratricopeptide (TPR) repeat protein